jgi:hypothetical protein
MNTPTVPARLFKLGVGLLLMLAGVAVSILLFIPYHRARETRAWTETPCVISENRMDRYNISDLAEPVARVFLKYTYTFDGREYTGTRYHRITFASSEEKDVTLRTPHFEDAEKLAEKYPLGLKTTCWVNPAAPAEVVLAHDSSAAIYVLGWPLLFVIGGGGIVWSSLRRKKQPLPG